MPLQPRSLILVVLAVLLATLVAVSAGGPIWLLHLGSGFATLVAGIGYDRWYERNRSQ